MLSDWSMQSTHPLSSSSSSHSQVPSLLAHSLYHPKLSSPPPPRLTTRALPPASTSLLLPTTDPRVATCLNRWPERRRAMPLPPSSLSANLLLSGRHAAPPSSLRTFLSALLHPLLSSLATGPSFLSGHLWISPTQRTYRDEGLEQNLKNCKKNGRSRSRSWFQNFTSGTPSFLLVAHQASLPVVH
jgi:hypothetical protein